MPRRSTSLLCPAKDANSWKNERNPLDTNAYIWHQLGEKPREIKAALGTHAPQQTAQLLDDLVGERNKILRQLDASGLSRL